MRKTENSSQLATPNSVLVVWGGASERRLGKGIGDEVTENASRSSIQEETSGRRHLRKGMWVEASGRGHPRNKCNPLEILGKS